MAALDVIGMLQAFQQLERSVSVSLMYSGLRIPQFRLLDKLDEMQSATVTELSRVLKVTRATASVAVNELIRSGVVVVEENAEDRRSFHIHLSELGRNKLNVARSDLAVLCSKLSQRYSAEMIEVLNRFARGKWADPA
ncbi:MAG: MarR family transcriptional regulator [Candidatus Thiodiazotropha sp.]